ncbi:MAG TPA: hypothetical protein DIW82_07115, partial [Corynebacterium nuruki]|nr:hypothetical protein [Corynebacterium nuruki]
MLFTTAQDADRTQETPTLSIPSMPDIPKPGRKSKIIGIIAVVIAVLVFLVPVLVTNYTDLLWFRSIDFSNVFLGVVATRVILFVVFGLVAAI